MIPPYRISLDETATPARLISVLEATFARVHPGAPFGFIRTLVSRVELLFRGGDGRHEAIDMAYHNLEHTLQTALCLARMYEGRMGERARAPYAPDDFRRALAAMLYHDTGYLKDSGDHDGTGAKYTFVHEARSADLAAQELAELGWCARDITAVRLFIQCTGPSSRPDRQPFENDRDAELGAMVCTADFLGQMSDPNYLRKLPALYREFEEAYAVRGLPHELRPFSSFDDLLGKTPAFWRHFVLPKLTTECREVYRYLAVPGGDNPYLDAVADHLHTITAGRAA